MRMYSASSEGRWQQQRTACARSSEALVAWSLVALLLLSACAEHEAPVEPVAQEAGWTPAAITPDASLDAGVSHEASTLVDTGPDVASDAPQEAKDADVAQRADAADAASTLEASTPSALPRRSLVLHESWQRLDAAADPFEDRPAEVVCLASGVIPQTLSGESVLDVETGACPYVTVTQPTQRDVLPGEVIKVRLWHFELSAPDPAEAHAVVMVDGLRVVDERIPIPAPGGLVVRQVRVERAIPAGAPVHFHLHNHGANSWALVEVSAGPG